jgi:Meckel syndrome type 1 protein
VPTGTAAPGFSLDQAAPSAAATRPEGAPITAGLPAWWPYAAGGLGALALLSGFALAWRRRKARPLRLAAPVAGAPASDDDLSAAAPPRLDLSLEIIAATRSLMMFTLEYRLTIANRSERAVGDLNAAVQLACARASAAPSAGAAQALAAIDRIGPHQARSLTGTVQLPLSAVQPLRQGQTPLFVPLVHVTLEAESLPAWLRTFVIGTPSASGRVHPIALDVPPGGIAGLVAQAVTVPSAQAPATAAA